MYQEYMVSHPEASVKNGRNYVRTHFHIYNKNINDEVANGGFALNLPDIADDSTHTNIKGSRELAAIITNLISEIYEIFTSLDFQVNPQCSIQELLKFCIVYAPELYLYH